LRITFLHDAVYNVIRQSVAFDNDEAFRLCK
jgi:hypothetical protein